MILFKEAADLEKYIGQQKKEGKIVGFVPTMGALHEGHLSLIKNCKDSCDITVCSIFVNPTQFNDAKDFEKYPISTATDILQLENAVCDVLFLPSVTEIYPNGTQNLSFYELGEIENLLEGKFRPGHFQGVCQVVHRLLTIVSPHFLYMGQKDYQQCMVVKKMVETLKLDVVVKTVDTLREQSGLAMSSRNQRLTADQKQHAKAISKTLQQIKNRYRTTPFKELETEATEYLLKNGFTKIDYVSIANAENLQPADETLSKDSLVALVAATIGEIRLIDNTVLT
jgi:pantoate--beta-alanine ligase